MTYPTDADVEAMARAIDPEAWDSIDYARRERDQVKSWYLELQEHHAQESLARARAAFSTLPHYLRAVETLERLRSASKHGESRGRSSGSDPVRVAEEASLPDADLIRAVEEREGLIEALEACLGVIEGTFPSAGPSIKAIRDNARAALAKALEP